MIDLATRMVVGWQMADHMRTSLVTDALQMAVDTGLVADQAIFHSGPWHPIHVARVRPVLQGNRVRNSAGRTGVCWDNAVAGSFFASLKNEMYYAHDWPTRARARFAVAEYIEVYYNRRRLHSSLGYRTPAEVLTAHHTAAQAA